MPESVFGRLMAVIEDRHRTRPAGSYTTRLFDGGLESIAAKVREESGELIEAAAESGDDAGTHVVHEAADLVYHLFVLLVDKGVGLADVEAELERRFGTSGLDEKASRGANTGKTEPT